ncbi:hypothetical protein HK099_003709 [Clydaea vesicula]|uniref:Uncharacterized protein n=1 Tax=Clydaea vesicula TaxID=447962 RepID=A0AAD5U1A9_9FUNG|nr:hypothetical protein HK099_003709 [Clydaea vesicula]
MFSTPASSQRQQQQYSATSPRNLPKTLSPFSSPSPYKPSSPSKLSNLSYNPPPQNQLLDAAQNLKKGYDIDALKDMQEFLKSNVINEQTFKFPIVDKFKSIPLPQILLDQYNYLQTSCFMGLLHEINRAYIVIDNRLFIWNYEKGEEYHCFEDQEETIRSVGIVKPLPGIFIKQIEWIIVVATKAEVILLGLAFASSDNETNDLTLYNTNIVASTDGIPMNAVIGTKNGRIFMAGVNGHLYELIYHKSDGWFTRKCYLRNCSAGFTQYLPLQPILSYFNSQGLVKQIVFDEKRQILYFLNGNNDIDVYLLISNGVRHVQKISNLYNTAKHTYENYSHHRGNLEENDFSILSVHPVVESTTIFFVAITTSGFRLYFRNSRTDDQLSTLSLMSVKAPIGLSQGTANPGETDLHVAYYSNAVMLGATTSKSEQLDCLVALAPDVGNLIQKSLWSEISSYTFINGKTWAIAEVPLTNFRGKKVDIFGLNELELQLLTNPRKFVILGYTGVNILNKRRPIDILQQLILDSNNQFTPKLVDFINSYGSEQTCAMFLTIACGHPSVSSISLAAAGTPRQIISSSATLINSARKFFFELNTKPNLNQRMNNPFDNSNRGNPDGSAAPNFSSRHLGLVLYLSRLLKQLWNSNVIKRSENNEFQSNIDIFELVDTQNNLISLNNFLEANPNFTSVRVSSTDNLINLEQQSLHNLHELLKQTMEAISFIQLLSDHNLNLIFESINKNIIPQYSNLTWEMMITSKTGRDLGKLLIETLVKIQVENQISIDAVSEMLRQRCPSFYSPENAIFSKANEHLERAKNVSSKSEKMEHLKESLRLYSRVTNILSYDKLKQICDDYISLNFHEGAVNLSLQYAQAVDYSGAAVGYNPLIPSTDPLVQQAFSLRLQAYGFVFDTLSSLDEETKQSLEEVEKIRHKLYNIILSSNDDYEMNLERRISYLSSAIVNARSAKASANDVGTFLNDLEEISEVASVQLEIRDALRNQGNENYLLLDETLFTISHLFNKYARPFQLDELILLILHTSGHKDISLVKESWSSIIQKCI